MSDLRGSVRTPPVLHKLVKVLLSPNAVVPDCDRCLVEMQAKKDPGAGVSTPYRDFFIQKMSARTYSATVGPIGVVSNHDPTRA